MLAQIIAECATHPVLFALKIAAAASGLYAAWLWLRASKVPTLPGHVLDGRSESGDPEMQRLDELDGYRRSTAIAGALNAKAARWTAVSVGLNAVVSFLPS